MHQSADEGFPGGYRFSEHLGKAWQITGRDRGSHIGTITAALMMERGRKVGFAEETIPTD